ncbi:ABC transporter ATP-binding protein [Henriciella litoralis]|uniref:ABC transporter ATP-binding protein n=1 Tax=Henriciella litoralis TaxID=568102 RepID=UPI001F3C361C|nr:ABC transporter ATP-binding protein [Henriciella litoralis]
MLRSKNGRVKGFQVLEDISFKLEEGDRLALIGRNGSGKSTLLRVLHSVFTPDSGTIETVGMTDALFELATGTRPAATGYQNIMLGGLMRGFTRDEIEAKVPGIAEFSELGDFLHLPMSTYSAGMRMRLLFSLATAFDPEIVLLDEWVSAGDAQFRAKAAERMTSHVEKAGILVIASHSARLIKRNCNKALWLEQGKIVRMGDLDSVFEEFNAVIQQGSKPMPEFGADF